MAKEKEEKLNERMKRIISEFIERESNRTSLITITRCEISRDLERLKVYFTVLPESEEEKVLSFLNRKKWEARDYLKKRIRTRIIPKLSFIIDEGEKNRQKIDQLLRGV